MTQPALFFVHPRHGALKRALGRVLAVANAGAAGVALAAWREEVYALKRTLLERYADRDGTDWQHLTKPCWGCEDCADWMRYGRRDYFQCGGTKLYSEKWIPLARWRLGGRVFHTPGVAVYEKPDAEVKFRERIQHREVGDEEARAAFAQLLLWFDREAFRRLAARPFAIESEVVPF